MNVPFVDLYPQYEELKTEIDSAITETIAKSAFIQGKPVSNFEADLAKSVGVKHAVGVANCTSAGWMLLQGMGIGNGDEVITTPLTAVPTAEYMTLAGARPVFADLDPATFQISPEAIEAAITPRTKAIIPVHLYGIPANLPRIFEIAKKHNLPVIEDCAQAQGAEVGGKRVGSLGVAGLFSFFPSKNLGGFGDGGALLTDNDDYEKYVRMYSNHGRLEKFTHEIPGANERLDAIQARVLHIKLTKLDVWNANRRKIADVYKELLADVEEVQTPSTYPDTTPVWHLYVIRAENRDELAKHLKERGIGSGLHYPLPLHEQPAMRFDYKTGDFPEAERATKEILSIPMYPHMATEQAEYVCKSIKEYYAKAHATVAVS
jgi:dTDP-4-amino-4,6-dideoxygalactose transaminase